MRRRTSLWSVMASGGQELKEQPRAARGAKPLMRRMRQQALLLLMLISYLLRRVGKHKRVMHSWIAEASDVPAGRAIPAALPRAEGGGAVDEAGGGE